EQETLKTQERNNQRRSMTGGEQQNPFAATEDNSSGGNWYFYNPSAVSAGRAEFMRRWGDRPLQDNWRRQQALRNIQAPTADNDSDLESMEEEPAMTEESQRNNYQQEIMSLVPFSPEAKAAAHTKLEDAFYTLGNIYNFNLEEPKNAQTTFVDLLDRYPETDYEPEVLYLLYIISNNLAANQGEKYKDQLLSEFPNSTYAKTIINPNYKQESEAISAELKLLYADAFKLYEKGKYPAADSLLNLGLNNYEDNDFTDNLNLLKIMIVGRTDSISVYQSALQIFLMRYPESDVLSYAQTLLDATHNFQNAQNEARSYKTNLDQEHLFIVVYNKSTGLADFLSKQIDTLSENSYKEKSLRSGKISLTEKQGMIMVNEFQNQQEAQEYLNLYNATNPRKNEFTPDMVQEFVITKENFLILYKTKDLKIYDTLYEEHY